MGGKPVRRVSSSSMAEIDRYGSSDYYRLLRSDGSVAECNGGCSWL